MDKFCGGERGVTPALLFAVAKAVLLYVKTFTEGGGVESQD
jgi:hypothetical protein